MSTFRLFIGYSVDSACAEALSSVDETVKSAYISEEFLFDISFEKKRFLGRYVDKTARLADLEQMELHVNSLLKKLLPNYPFPKTPLDIFGVDHA